MSEKFGERVRRLRLAKGLGLRETATKVAISATYLSRIETNEEKTAPAEKVIRALADLLGDNFDTLMNLAGRIPLDVEKIIVKDPGMPSVLRSATKQGYDSEKIAQLIKRDLQGKK